MLNYITSRVIRINMIISVRTVQGYIRLVNSVPLHGSDEHMDSVNMSEWLRCVPYDLVKELSVDLVEYRPTSILAQSRELLNSVNQ